MRITLCLAGIILTTVQLVKYFTYAPDERGFASLVIGLCLGILCLLLSIPPAVEKIVAKFAARVRSRRFAVYTYLTAIGLICMFISMKVALDYESWRRMSSEGSVSEYGTALAYLLTTVFAYPISRQFGRQQHKFLALAYGFLTVAAFVVGMEEISWGQRLIGFEEPQFWSEHNLQSEFTLHNLSFYQHHILNQSFVLAGLVGSFGWLALRYWQKRQRAGKIDWSYILPGWSVSAFFYPNLLFYPIYLTIIDDLSFLAHHDQEHCEFLMSLGILLFVIINFFRQVKETSKNY
ncbi:MAG: hypothetical protein AAFQ41_02550 [Cyanobacteria bacterium J06623_7]